MNDTLVSVIIPTFNRAQVVRRAVDSVLEQTYRSIELIVVDDGSTDETAAVLQTYGDALVYVRQDNAGPSAARNRGIHRSQGEFIAFLDSDDTWLATKLERQVALLRNAGEDVPCCLCSTAMHMPNGQTQNSFEIARLELRDAEGVCSNPAAILATRFVLFVQAALVRRRFLLDCGGFDEHLWFMEDHDLALRLALRGPWALIREPLAMWCGAGDDSNLSVTARKQRVKLYQSIEYIDRKILERENLADDRVRRYLQRDLRGLRHKLLAERWIAGGRLFARLGAGAVMGWERLRGAWFRRSWCRPSPEMTPLRDVVKDV